MSNGLFITKRTTFWLIALFSVISIYDDTLIISNIPMFRNPSSVIAISFLVIFLYTKLPKLRLELPQVLVLLFLAGTLLVEVSRIVLPLGGPAFSLSLYMQWVQIVVLFFAVSIFARDPTSVPYIWGGAIAATLMVVLATLTGIGLVENNGRSGFFAINLNSQAFISSLTLLSALWFLLERWPRFDRSAMIAMAVILLAFLGLLSTASRTGFVGMTAGGLTLMLIQFRGRRRSAYAFILPAILLVFVVAIQTNDLILERFTDAVVNGNDGKRGYLMELGLSLLQERPWRGHGAGFGYVIAAEYGLPPNLRLSSHNTFFQISLSFGIPCAVLFLCFFFTVLSMCARNLRYPIGRLYFALMVSSVFTGITGDLGYNKYFWILLSIVSNINNHRSIDVFHKITRQKPSLEARTI